MITADAIDLPVSARHFIEFHSDLCIEIEVVGLR